MAQRLVIDPITRIEGHLRIEAELDANNTITQGILLRHDGARHRDHPERPRPARSLGICPARLRCLHHRPLLCLHPLGGRCPGHPNPQGCQPDPQPDDHPAVRARPCDALLSPARAGLGGRDRLSLRPTRLRLRTFRKQFHPGRMLLRLTLQRSRTRSRQLPTADSSSIFANAYWGHPAYKLPPEVNLLAVAHYLEALDAQQHLHQDPHHLRRQESAPELRGRRRAHAD